MPSLINWSRCIRCGSMMIFQLHSSYRPQHYLSFANTETTLMLFLLYGLVIFSLSFIRIFINVSPQLPDCSHCRCSSSVHGQQQSRYPCPAFFTLVAHRKINLIASTNWGLKDTWLVVLKSVTVTARRPKLCLLFSDTFASDCLYFDAAHCLQRSVCYSSLP